MELTGKKINFLGDSITEGVGTTSVDKTFASIINKECKLAAARNYGIGGTRFARQSKPSVNPRWDKDFCSRIDGMDSDADIVVVFGGTNDFGHGDAVLGSFGGHTTDTFYGACHYLMENILKKFAGSAVFFLTPLPRADVSVIENNKYKGNGAEYLKTYADIIKEVAAYYSIKVLDLNTECGINPVIPEINKKYYADGLHLNDEGHKYLAQRIINFIKSY